MPKYTSSFYGKFEINTPEEAYRAVMDFCERYCGKGGIEQFHCSGRDAAICDKIKEQICRDFNRKQGKNAMNTERSRTFYAALLMMNYEIMLF